MPTSLQIRSVVFDLDGLMFNTEELYDEVGGRMLRRRGKEFTRELKYEMMGRPSRIALQIMIDWHGLADSVEQLQDETTEIFKDLLPARLETMPGLIDLLDALEAGGFPKAVATSSRPHFTQTVLSRFSLVERFSFILTAEDVTHGKPHPEVYLTAAERFGHPPQQMLVLEDSENGCRAAVDAGAFAVAVPGQFGDRNEYRGAKFIAESLADRRIYKALGM